MIRATQLSYSATSKWDLYDATYDIGTQDFSAIGPGVDGWTIRPVYRLLQLMTRTVSPVGGSIVDVVPAAGADLTKLVTAYISPSGDVTILGLDTDGAAIATGWEPVVLQPRRSSAQYAVPPPRLERRREWHEHRHRVRRHRLERNDRGLRPAPGRVRAHDCAPRHAPVVS